MGLSRSTKNQTILLLVVAVLGIQLTAVEITVRQKPNVDRQSRLSD